MRYIVSCILFISSLSATAQIDLRQLIPDSTQYMIPVTDSLIASEYYQKYRQLANTIFIKDDSICYQLLVDGDTTCAPIDTIQVIYGDPTDTSYYFQVQVNGGTIDSITHMELIQINNGTGINVTYNGTAITIASTVTDTDTYIDSVRQITAGVLDSIWLYRNDLSDSLLIVLNDSVIPDTDTDTYIDSIRHVNDGVLDSVWFYRSDMSDSLLLVLNDSVGAGGGGSDTYIDSVRQVVVGSLDSIWLYRSDLSDSLLIVLNDSTTTLPQSRFVFTDPSTGELTTDATWADSILLYNGSQRYGLMDDDNNVSFGRLVGAGGSNNLKLGGSAGYRNTGDHNTYLGFESGYLSLTASHLRNVGIGSGSGLDASGDDNIYLGSQSGRYNVSDFSTYIGVESGYMTVVPSGSSDNNLAMGYQSARDAEGDNNVYLGNQAGLSTEGSNNIFIGSISTLTGSVSNRLAIGGPSDYFIDGNMSTDSLTVNSTVTVRDVPASSDPDSVYVLGPGHELNSYPISSISGIDTYIDSAAIVENGLTDTLWYFRDSSGVHIDSFHVVLNDSVIPDTYIDSVRQITVGLQDSVWLYRNDLSDSLLVTFQDSIFQDHDWYEIPTTTQPDDIDDNIWTNSRVRIGQDSLENAFTVLINGGIAPFEMVSSAPTNIMRQRHRAQNTAWDHSYQAGVYSIISQNLNTAESGYYISMPEGYVGDATRPLVKIDSSDIGFWKYPSSRNDVTSVDSISALYYPAYDGEIRVAPIDSVLKRLDRDSTTHRDFDFLLLAEGDTLGTNLDSLIPDDSLDLYNLIWHGGQVRLHNTEWDQRYDTLAFGPTDSTTALQIMGERDAIDIYHNFYPYIWMRNAKADAHWRLHNNDNTVDSFPAYMELGFTSWYDSTGTAYLRDTSSRWPLRISSQSNHRAFVLERDSLILGDYKSSDVDASITVADLAGSAFYMPSATGKVQLVSPDTVNAFLNVVSSNPDIAFWGFKQDSFGINFLGDADSIFADFSHLNNSNIYIGSDTLYLGDTFALLPQGADSSGVVIPTGEIYFGQNTRAPNSSPSLSFDGSTALTLDQGGEGSAYFEFIDNNSVFATFNKVSSGASYGIMDFSVSPSNGSDAAIIRFNRNSGTSGASYVDVHYGDGSAATGARIGGDNTDSWIARYANLAVGHNSPTAQLHVDGDVRLENLSGSTPTQMVWADANGKLRFVNPGGTFDNYNSWQFQCFACTGSGSANNITSGEALAFTAGSGISLDYDGSTVTVSASGGSDEYANSLSFNTGNGILTIGRAVGSDLTEDLDGRYLTAEVDGSTTNEIQDIDLFTINATSQVLSLSLDGVGTSTVDLTSTIQDVINEQGAGGIYSGSGTVGGGSSVTASVNSGTSFTISYNGGDAGMIVNSAGVEIEANTGGDDIFLNADGWVQFNAAVARAVTGTEIWIGFTGNQSAGVLEVSGDAYKSTGGDTWLTTSDRRIKENIQELDSVYDKILALRPVTFNYNDAWLEYNELPKDNKQLITGYIAQEYGKVFPQDIKYGTTEFLENGEPVQQLSANAVNPYTVAAVQQLIKEVQELKQEIENLKQK